MKLLLFSDLHNVFRTAAKLVELSNAVDVGAGDFCVARQGLDETIATVNYRSWLSADTSMEVPVKAIGSVTPP